MARPKGGSDRSLTTAELQIMNLLWEMKSATVHDILERLNGEQNKDYAYTTVSTLLRVLEKKSVVSSEKEGRGHRYFPRLKQKEYRQRATEHLVQNVYQNEKGALIKNLLGHT